MTSFRERFFKKGLLPWHAAMKRREDPTPWARDESHNKGRSDRPGENHPRTSCNRRWARLPWGRREESLPALSLPLEAFPTRLPACYAFLRREPRHERCRV